MYLAANERALSAVLTRDTTELVYFTSKALTPVESRNPPVEKMAYALVLAARRLRPYFQAHTIQVLTSLPMRSILHRPSTSDRLTKWVIELSEFDVVYRLQPAIKAQALADFIVEKSFREPIREIREPKHPAWTLHVDRALNQEGCGTGLVLKTDKGLLTKFAITLGFASTNNEAEYEALIAGLEIALTSSCERLECFCDSYVVSNQIQGSYEARTGMLPQYHSQATALLPLFKQGQQCCLPGRRTGSSRITGPKSGSSYGRGEPLAKSWRS